ncbi:sigma-E processing peptidase SpoIIGA [Sporomusa aerivorans]|uniref:sigma-E processing peptidase SpoIIGA n=1 Tax=Sporomusa aerivorans TaxID=204936 RepID=UPI00352B21DC
MYVYADVVLLINFIMNSIVLFLTAHATCTGFRWQRLLLAAFCGGLYALGEIIPKIALVYSAPGKLAASVIIIFVAFGYRSVKTMLMLVGTFYVVSFVLGGAAIGWLYFIQNEASYRPGSILASSWSSLAISSAIAVILIIFIARRLIHKLSRRQTFYQTKIEYDGRWVTITGMLDTGNSLYSMIGKKPVVLLAWQAALPLVGPAVSEYLTRYKPEGWLANLDNCRDTSWLARVEVIPCQSVGGRNMLLGFRPDSIVLITPAGAIHTTEVLIGLYSDIFNCDTDYQALLHPALTARANSTEGANICALPGQ